MSDQGPSWPVAIAIALLIAAALMLTITWALDVPASHIFGGFDALAR